MYAFLKTINITMHLIPWPICRTEYTLVQVACGTVSTGLGVNAIMFSFLLLFYMRSKPYVCYVCL